MTTCELLLRAGVFGAVLASTLPAHADVSAEDRATARALFTDARKLMTSGNYAEACPKLEAASKLYPGSGVLLNLGDCYEHTGRTASAWAEFGEAASSAARSGRGSDEAEAKRRQAALEPRLARLAVRVRASAPGLSVRRDEAPLAPGAWGVAIPVDPGAHTIKVDAPGRLGWSTSVTVTEAGKTVTIDVPELAPAPADPPRRGPVALTAPTAPAPPPAPPYWTPRRAGGLATTLIGVAGAGVGGALGLVAKARYDKASGEAGAARHDDSTSAVLMGNVATGAVVSGGVVAVIGLVVWLTAPKQATATGDLALGWRF